jgi:hypothetical protein
MVTLGHDDVCIVTDTFLSADLDATAPKEDAVGARWRMESYNSCGHFNVGGGNCVTSYAEWIAVNCLH